MQAMLYHILKNNDNIITSACMFERFDVEITAAPRASRVLWDHVMIMEARAASSADP